MSMPPRERLNGIGLFAQKKRSPFWQMSERASSLILVMKMGCKISLLAIWMKIRKHYHPVLYFEGEEGEPWSGSVQRRLFRQYPFFLSIIQAIYVETGLKSAITKVMNDYARKTDCWKKRIKIWRPPLPWGLSGCSFSILVPEESICSLKDRPTSWAVRLLALRGIFTVPQTSWTFSLLGKWELASNLIRKAITEMREAARKAMKAEVARRTRKTRGFYLEPTSSTKIQLKTHLIWSKAIQAPAKQEATVSGDSAPTR